MGDHKTRYRRYTDRIADLRLIDDVFFGACAEDNIPFVQKILRVILNKPDLVVLKVFPQKEFKNLYGHSVRFDANAVDKEGKVYDIEVERSDKPGLRKRARYYSSILDAGILKAGKDYKSLPESYIILLTEKDVIGKGKAIYLFERYSRGEDGEEWEALRDGSHIVFVNGAKRDTDTEIGRLMYDFFCKDPDKMYNRELAERAKAFKTEQIGEIKMGNLSEKIWRDGRAEGLAKGRAKANRETAQRMLGMGRYSVEEVAECSNIPLSEVKELARQFA